MSSYTPYHRQYYLDHKQQILEDNKSLRVLRKRLHLCRDCGKQDAYTMNGRPRCAECVERDTERNRIKRGYRPAWQREERSEKPLVNYPRGDNGICWQCNKKPCISGRHLCQECYLKKVEIARRYLNRKDTSEEDG